MSKHHEEETKPDQLQTKSEPNEKNLYPFAHALPLFKSQQENDLHIFLCIFETSPCSVLAFFWVTLTKFSCKWELELNNRDLEQITDVEGMVIISRKQQIWLRACNLHLQTAIRCLQMPYAVSFQFCDLKQDVFTGSKPWRFQLEHIIEKNGTQEYGKKLKYLNEVCWICQLCTEIYTSKKKI